ncbi:TolB family protein [Spirosoma fluviale]|uniref:WD40-like Beta Propeller Repeat n=1 Tax=Spirosoma fluviale TaxID=1597977 RepID=A0A286GA35_9BACT|nr:PD40 domain-containing protein [Spirosoma fluviale]SOD92395.1 WD40-like Beta Propeller Repeat [Spirosoma fluviale]
MPSLSLPNLIRLPVFGGLALLLLLIRPSPVRAQSPPEADIFLVDLTLKSQPVQVGKPVNITQRKGYDNQPSFTPDSKGILYTSMRQDGQTDIYRYDLSQKSTTPLTRTVESEYSPIVTPDKEYFSVIRVEKDKTQRLWKFPISGTGEPTLVLPTVKPVGYHCWLTPDRLALFILGTPNSLQLAQVSTGDTTRIEGNVGRCILKIPGKNAISFVHKRTATEWDIKQLDLQTRQITALGQTLPGSEDYVWTPDGTLLMCQGALLYQLKPATAQNWTQLADFSATGIKQLTRMAIDTDGKKLALVGQ